MPKGSSSFVRVSYPKLSKDDVVKLLSTRLKGLSEKLSLHKVVLFGSYATGRFTASSDIDLLIVYEGERRSDAYNLAVEALMLPRLEPHCYSKAEYEALVKSSKGFTKMLKTGIQVYPL